jgi:hypothetical protein
MMRLVRTLALWSIVLGAASVLAPRAAVAQEHAGSLYVFGGLGATHQSGPTGEVSVTYVTAPGGTTAGWLVGGGVSVAKSVSIDAELSSTGTMTAREPSRYGMTFNDERRDRFVTIGARLSFPPLAPVRIEPVIGLVLTFPHATSQVDTYTYWMTPQQVLVHEPAVEHHLDIGIGPAFGCDARIGSRRIAFVPSFRVFRTRVSNGRYDDSSYRSEIGSIYPGGYPDWTIRAGGAVRIDF